MATKSVSVRIPEEALAELEKIARLKNLKVSDVVRDLILEKLTGGSQADNRLVLEYLEGFGNVLAGIHQEAARSRYYSELMTSYGADIQNLMVAAKPMDKTAKEVLMERFGAASVEEARQSWLRVLGVKPEQDQG